MADFVPVGGVREITDKDEIERVDKLLNTPLREEVEKQGGMASDRDPIYTQPDKTVGPKERLRLESEAETGVETTTLGAIGRLVGDVFFLGDTRKIAQKNALSDIMKREWTEYAPMQASPVAAGFPREQPRQKVTIDAARNPEALKRKVEAAGLNFDAVRSLADEKIAFRKSIGEPADDNAALMDAAQTLAENELVNRVHVSSRARRTLPGEGGKNEAGFGYSVIGGGLRNLPYAGQFTLGSAVAGPAGLVLPLLAAYDRRYNANRESDYLIDPETGGVKETKAGLGAAEAVVPSMLGAIGEVGVETLGGKVFDMVGKRVLGGLISKLGGERLMKNSSSIRTIVKSFEDIAKVTRTHSYPAEIAEEWQQELLDAAIESTAEYRGSGDLNERLQKATEKFGENFGEIALSMILTQAGQAAIAAGKSTDTISRERKGEQEAASRLRAIGVDEETVKNLLADRDARSVIEYISNLSPEATESAMKRISARSVKAAEEIKKTAEWMDSLGDKGATSRFVAPSPADMIPGEDGMSRYVDPVTETEITYDRVNKEVGVRNGKTGRYAFVSDGPVGERMQRAFAVADTFDKEAQGRDIVNEKKRETLARVLEAKGVDGTYVIVNNVEELAAQNLSNKAKAAYENLDEMGKLPQAFVDTGDVEGAEPVTYFVLDHIRLGEGPGAIAKTMQNIVDAATHEPVHLAAKSPKAAAAFRQMYDKADERLRLEIISEGIRRERGKAAVKQILDENSASADDTPETADAKDKNLRRWFEEGIAYLNEGTITEQSTAVQRTARKVRDFFKADIKTLTDIGVLTERAMRDAKGTVIVRRGNEPRVISGQEADTAEDAVEETVRQAETAKETAPVAMTEPAPETPVTETAPVEEAVPEAPEGAEPPPVEDRAATSADTERTVAKLSGAERKTESGETFYHGGLPKGATLDNVDLDRSGTQQNKNGRSYGGFYLTDASSKAWSEKYASRRSGVLHALRFKPGSSVFTTRANIDRLSADQRAALKAAGYAAIEGKDTLGRNQVVLLDKTAVESFAEEPETLAVAPASVEEVDGVFKAVPAPVTATTPEEAIAPTPVAQESEKGPQVPPAKNESRPQAVARIKKAFAAREPVPVADIEKYGLEVPDTYGLKDGAYVFTPAVGNGGGTQAQPTQDQGDKKTERDRKETRKQALRDLAEAYGDEIWKDGVANGDFAGDGELNIDEQGNVLLTRHADSFGGLTKKGSTMTREELRNVALGGGTYGGSSVNTSAMLGWGEKSWAAAEMTAGEEGRYTGVFKIPKAVLEQMLRDGDAALAGINHGEVILRPEVAEKWLYSVNGKPFSPQISMAQEETETTQEEPAQPPAKKLTRPQRVAAIKKAFKAGEPVSADEIDALSMNIPDTYARQGDKYVKLAGVPAEEQEAVAQSLTDSQRSFGEELAKKYGAPVKPIKGAIEPYESLARFGNMLEKAADKTTDADELAKILDQSKGLVQESRIVWAILNNPHTSAEVYAMAKKNEAVRATTSDENIARLDIRRKELREQRGLDKQPSERGVPAKEQKPAETPEEAVAPVSTPAEPENGLLREEFFRSLPVPERTLAIGTSEQRIGEFDKIEELLASDYESARVVYPIRSRARLDIDDRVALTDKDVSGWALKYAEFLINKRLDAIRAKRAIAPKPAKKETIDEAGKLERMTPEEQMRAIGLYGKDGKANMAHPLAARMLTGKMRSIPVGELITVRGKPDTLTKRWLELNGYTLQGDRYVAPENGTQAAETPAKAVKAPERERVKAGTRVKIRVPDYARKGETLEVDGTVFYADTLPDVPFVAYKFSNKFWRTVEYTSGLSAGDTYGKTKAESLEKLNKAIETVGVDTMRKIVAEANVLNPMPPVELEQPTTKKEATDAESIRSDEGQVRAGGEKGQPEVQRGAEQGGGDLQRQAPEAPRGEQGAVKAPELMTPEEGKGYKLPRGRGADILPSMDMMSDGKTPVSSRASEADGTLDHAIAVATAVRNGKPVNASAVDTYGIKLPTGYTREGDLYVFKPETPPDDGGKKSISPSVRERETQARQEVIASSDVSGRTGPTIPKGAKVVTTYDDKGVSYSGEFVRDNGDGTSLIRAFGERPKKGLFRRYGVGRDGVQTVKDIAVSNDKVKMTEPPADLSKLTPAQRTALRRAASAQESVMDTEIAAGETVNTDVVADMAAIEERGERKRTDNEIMFRVTPQEDAEYMAAVESGDMAKAQKMVDDVAKKAGYERETFRGDSMPEKIFVYEPRKRREVGIFTTPLRQIADMYAEGGRFSNTSRRFYVRAPKVLDLTKDTVENARWVTKWGESFDEWFDRQSGEEMSAWDILQGGRMFDYEGDWSAERWGDLQATAELEGYDAVILPDYDRSLGVFPSLVVFDSNNLKLADPITRDDQGNIVPLSQRFNAATPDIRFRVDQTKTPEFKSWFGDSKVVDADGKPLMVYHGTKGDFTIFDYGKIGKQGRSEGAGFYFTNNRDVASAYGQPMEAYLSIKNPLPYDAPPFNKITLKKLVLRLAEIESSARSEDVADGFLSNYGDVRYQGLRSVVEEAVDTMLSDETALEQIGGLVGGGAPVEFVNRAVRDVTGHDGYVATGFSGEGTSDNMIYVAFFPEQIKSATANVGTFDPTNPDIRFRVDQNEEQDRVESARKTFRELVALMENNPADFRLAHGEPQTRIDKPVIFDKQDLQRVAKVVTGSPLQTFASVSQSGEMNEAMATFNEYEVRSIIDRVVLENRPIENNDTVAKIRIFLQARLEDAAQADDDLAAAMRKKDTARQYAIVDTKDALLRDLDQASRALDLIGSERGRQLAFLKTGLDRNLSVVYRVSMIRKITGRMVTVEEYDKIVERVKEDRKRMKELAANHEKVRLEEARKFREATETARAEAEKKALEAYRRGVAEERANFAFVQNDADADYARRVDPSAGYEGFNTDEIAFRIDDTADGRNKGTYPGALRDLARSVFTQVKAEGGGTVTFARRMFEQGRAKGFDGKLIDRYVYDFNKRLGIAILQDAPAALPPRSPSGNAAKIKNADARRTAQVKEAVRRAVAEDMEADGGKIAKRAIEILDKDQSEWAYLSPEDVMSIVTGYPAELEADTRDELEKRYSMIRNHMRTSQRIEEMKRGKYPTPMTLGNDAPDVTLRQLAREMRDMMNTFEFEPGETDPRLVNAQKALTNRLKYSIEELEKALKTGEAINEKAPRTVNETEEIRDLRNTLAVLREAYEALPAVEEIKEARDTERARRAANNRYHFWNKRLEDAKNGVFPETFKGTETADKDAEIASYRAKAEAARKEYWEIKKSSPQERLAAVTAKVTKAEERLASLEKDLAQTPVADPRAKKPAEMPPASPEEAAKRERLEELRTAISNVRKNILAKWRDENAEAIERAREADRFQFLVAKAKEIERKIKARDFTKTPKRPRVWSARIAIEEDKVRAGLRAINERILWEANNAAGWTGKAKNAYTWSGNAYRFFKASMDLSNLGVQSARLFSTDPIAGAKLAKEAISNAGNDERMAEFMSQLHNDPTYDIAYEAGLALDQQFDDVFGTGMGETFFRKLAEYKEGQGLGREVVSGAAGIALASQRVFDMYGRAMRFHVFKSIVNDPAHANLTKPQLRAIANMVNIMGGVGNTRVYSHGWSSVLSELMWSSRLFTSQWQTLAGGGGILWNAGLGPEGSKQALGREWWQTAAPGALKLYARSLAGNMALSQLFGVIGMMLGDRQPWEDDETFFWKAWDFLFGRRVIGSKNIDVTGGLTSYIALLRRVVDRSHVSMSGKTVPDDDWKAWAGTTANFFRGRLRPDLALVISMVFGEDVTGEPFGPRGGIKGTANAFFEATLPITPREMIATVGDMWNTHGVIGVTAGLIPALASDLFGFSKSTAPRDPRYEINRHKSRMGQVRKALEAGKESGDYTEYMRLRDVYAFDVGVSDSVSKLESSANKAKKIADNEKIAADYREEARQAEKWHLDKAREVLRGQR